MRATLVGYVLTQQPQESSMQKINYIQPHVIRLKDASSYLGVDKNRFNKEVRPSLKQTRIGIQGVAFDRLDLDAWFERYKELR